MHKTGWLPVSYLKSLVLRDMGDGPPESKDWPFKITIWTNFKLGVATLQDKPVRKPETIHGLMDLA
jgi:hypothetical protein